MNVGSDDLLSHLEARTREAERALKELEDKTKEYTDKSKYVGGFAPGPGKIPHGYGEFMKFGGRIVYEGEWKMGFMHGYGKYYWDNGESWVIISFSIIVTIN